MKQSQETMSAVRERSDMTGRDGAIDYTIKASAVEGDSDHERFARLLGRALIEVWGDLSQPIQERVFEHALAFGGEGKSDDALRERLAKFLHDHHPRTTG